MGCRMSLEDASQRHITAVPTNLAAPVPTNLDNRDVPDRASIQRVTRANSTHYKSAHEAAMAEIFRSGNGLVGLQNLGELVRW